MYSGAAFQRQFPRVQPGNTNQKYSLTASLTTSPETENDEDFLQAVLKPTSASDL